MAHDGEFIGTYPCDAGDSFTVYALGQHIARHLTHSLLAPLLTAFSLTYYGFLSPVKRRLLEEVVYVITETVRKTAMQIRWRGMYQRLPTGRAGPDA